MILETFRNIYKKIFHLKNFFELYVYIVISNHVNYINLFALFSTCFFISAILRVYVCICVFAYLNHVSEMTKWRTLETCSQPQAGK